RVQVARLRQGGRDHGRPTGGRRSQPPGPHQPSPPRVRVRRHRSELMGRIVVTGGAGFLGSHLCNRLLDRGDEVICLDNLITGSISNIESLFGRAGFTFVDHDVSSYLWVPGEVDAVMHFASPASPVDFE